MPEFAFHMYIAGKSPSSSRALATVESVCQQHLAGRCHLEVTDVLDESALALAEGVLVTPMLIKVAPAPVRRIIGNLSKGTGLFAALSLELDGDDRNERERE